VSGGLVALLDDVAALARIAAASVDDVAAGAAKAGAKAAGVVIDDAGRHPAICVRGGPVSRTADDQANLLGLAQNKLLIILPALLLVSAFIPGVIPFISDAGWHLPLL
jgi:predicted DNA repair protein MutK